MFLEIVFYIFLEILHVDKITFSISLNVYSIKIYLSKYNMIFKNNFSKNERIYILLMECYELNNNKNYLQK